LRETEKFNRVRKKKESNTSGGKNRENLRADFSGMGNQKNGQKMALKGENPL